MIQGEKECSYYMRTGQCKFGLTCRFNHPVPLAVQGPPQPQQQQPQPQPQLQTIYPTLQPQSIPSSQQYGLVLTRPSLLPGSYLQSPYGPPMVLPPGMVPYSGWNPYQVIYIQSLYLVFFFFFFLQCYSFAKRFLSLFLGFFKCNAFAWNSTVYWIELCLWNHAVISFSDCIYRTISIRAFFKYLERISSAT